MAKNGYSNIEESNIEEVEYSQQFYLDSNNKNVPQVSLSAMTGIAPTPDLKVKRAYQKEHCNCFN